MNRGGIKNIFRRCYIHNHLNEKNAKLIKIAKTFALFAIKKTIYRLHNPANTENFLSVYRFR